jgi:tripartite ATP-independent transporter DctM subunit
MNSFILIGVFLVLLALRLPVVFALLLSSLTYVVFIKPIPLIILAHRMVGSIETFPLLALPLYILAADIMNEGQISERLFGFARSLVGHIRGSLGHVVVVADMIFAGISGSISAEAAGLGKMELPMMTRAGYDMKFAVAVTSSSAIIGPIIPPSIQMILYGMIAEQSVGRLFAGGFIPGFIMGIMLMATVYVYAIKRNYPRDAKRASLKQMWITFKKAFFALLAPVIIFGGIVTGVFTPTEAGVVAVVYCFVVTYFIYRTLKLRQLIPMFVGTAVTTGLILLIMGAASVFGWLITMEDVPSKIRDIILATTNQQWVVLLMLNIAFLILGCFFDICAIILVFTPMILPVLKAFHVDLVHWGVVETLNVCIGFLTPPFGVGLFIMSELSGLKVSEVTRAIAPFLIPLIFSLFLITYIPELVLFLPRLIFGS